MGKDDNADRKKNIMVLSTKCKVLYHLIWLWFNQKAEECGLNSRVSTENADEFISHVWYEIGC